MSVALAHLAIHATARRRPPLLERKNDNQQVRAIMNTDNSHATRADASRATPTEFAPARGRSLPAPSTRVGGISQLLAIDNVLFLLTLLVLLADRMRLLTLFGFRYTDEDQALLWYAAEEAFHGRFHEPCFFGQSYNTTMEGVLAVPLYAVGVPLPYALPIITCLLGLLPFVVLAGLAWRQDRRKLAVLLIMVPLVLPIPYGMVATMPRGFVTGLALAAPAMALFLIGRRKRDWFVASLLGVLAVTANPNACLLLVALGVYTWLTHWKKLRFYAMTLAGAAVGSAAPLGIAAFYHAHPTYDLHRHPPLEFTLKLWHEGWAKLDLYLGHFTPWTSWHAGATPLVILGAMVAALLILWQWKAAVALAVAGGACVIVLGINRVQESGTSVFLSGSRMFLAVPVLYALGLFWLGQGLDRWHLWPQVRWTGLGTLILLALFIIVPRHRSYPALVRENLRDRTLQIYLVEDCERQARAIAEVADAQNVHMVLFAVEHDKTMALALPALTDGRCESLFPPFERRTWRMEEEARTPRDKVLLYTEHALRLGLDARTEFPGAEQVFESPHITCVTTDGETALDVARDLKIAVRRF